MKRILALSLAALAIHLSAAAAEPVLYSFESGFADGGSIPDGDLTGWQDTRTISDFADGLSITDVNVTLTISGGWSGDLYGYLLHDTGFAVLLNRTGHTDGNSAGYGDPGFNVTIDDDLANSDIHLYQLFSATYNSVGQLLGSWQSDARDVHPLTVLDTDPRTATLDSFNTLNPNGEWMLYLADVSSGEQSTITGWSMQITVVPEPAALIPSLLLLGWARLLHLRRTQRRDRE